MQDLKNIHVEIEYRQIDMFSAKIVVHSDANYGIFREGGSQREDILFSIAVQRVHAHQLRSLLRKSEGSSDPHWELKHCLAVNALDIVYLVLKLLK